MYGCSDNMREQLRSTESIYNMCFVGLVLPERYRYTYFILHTASRGTRRVEGFLGVRDALSEHLSGHCDAFEILIGTTWIEDATMLKIYKYIDNTTRTHMCEPILECVTGWVHCLSLSHKMFLFIFPCTTPEIIHVRMRIGMCHRRRIIAKTFWNSCRAHVYA